MKILNAVEVLTPLKDDASTATYLNHLQRTPHDIPIFGFEKDQPVYG